FLGVLPYFVQRVNCDNPVESSGENLHESGHGNVKKKPNLLTVLFGMKECLECMPGPYFNRNVALALRVGRKKIVFC
ncbi:MAG: hypothetical protein KC643_32780, partial [Nitrospira sp.]|nr:hypothetical protein [Nitrospira sp.]